MDRCYVIIAAACLFIGVAVAACGGDRGAEISPDALVVVDGDVLTRRDLEAAMPAALSADDSVKYARAYINAWIAARNIARLADDIDMTEIDKLVDQYRKELVMNEYVRRMCDENVDSDLPEDSLQAYYNRHQQEFKLTRPLIKGVYVKIDEKSQSLPQLRKLYRSRKEADIDKLDKSLLNGAIHYDYFRDKWVDWEQIESRVPYDFGASGDLFLRSHNYLDITSDGFTYLLDVSDVLHSGQTMPYEAARPLIIDKLNFFNRRSYQEQLKQELFDKGVESGRIKILCAW